MVNCRELIGLSRGRRADANLRHPIWSARNVTSAADEAAFVKLNHNSTGQAIMMVDRK
jgi:hypothetical protein